MNDAILTVLVVIFIIRVLKAAFTPTHHEPDR